MKRFKLSLIVSLIVFVILLIVHLKIKRPMLLLERFFPGFGWIEIVLISIYGAFVVYKMQDLKNSALWRMRIWTLFSIVFFGQLLLGIFGIDECLMKQDIHSLHFPIPAMILSGPLYRGDISFMTILFLSTVILTGPAWCSHLCYFGAIDGIASSGKGKFKGMKVLWKYRIFWLIIIILASLILRSLNNFQNLPVILISIFGILGFGIILFFSRRKKFMFHCLYWCPIGTIISVLKFVSPFRMKIQNNCSSCGLCSKSCKYLALEKSDIARLKPGLSCTFCGDCLNSCHSQSIVYSFFRLSPALSREIFLSVTIICHVVFLALARI